MSKPKADAERVKKPKPEPKPEIPNEETRQAMIELDRGGGKSYEGVKDMLKDLLS